MTSTYHFEIYYDGLLRFCGTKGTGRIEFNKVRSFWQGNSQVFLKIKFSLSLHVFIERQGSRVVFWKLFDPFFQIKMT